MKRRVHSFARLALVSLTLAALPLQAATKYTAKQLDRLDKLGAFTPEFKQAVHDYVNVEQAIADTQKEEAKLRGQVPGMNQQAVTDQAKVDALREKLAEYDHTDDSDFVVLQSKMNDADAKAEDQLLLAQVFLWSYPHSKYVPQAQTYLQQVQKLIADRIQAEKDAEAAKAAAWAKLLQRVQNRDLSLSEWKDFLNNLTQDDVTKYLGAYSEQDGYYWIYNGPWTFDPVINQKVGLRINFNGGRVVGVTEGASATGSTGTATNPTAGSD